MNQLDSGDVFPSLTFARTSGGTVRLPEDLAGHYGVVLVNRGAWCPFCTGQLTAFQRASADLAAADVSVVSFSTDDEPAASGLVSDKGLTFPVGHGADIDTVVDALGVFTDRGNGFLQASGFVLDPAGRVVVAVYSTGAIGRLNPADVIGVVQYHRSQTTS